MGIFALMYVLPHVETLGGFWAVFATGTAVAACELRKSTCVVWRVPDRARIYKVVLQGWAP
jgi:hypothetical protein